MITRIEAYRYRCFQHLDLAIGPYQVLVGRNGAGKSTLLDLPILIGEMLKNRDIEGPLFQPRGSRPARAQTPSDVLFAHAGESCVFVIEATIPDSIIEQIERTTFEALSKREQVNRLNNPRRRLSTIRYELGLGLRSGAFEIIHEFVSLLPEDRSLIRSEPVSLWGETVAEDDEVVRSVIRRSRDGVTLTQPEIRMPNEDRERKAQRLPLRANVPAKAPALSGVPLDLSQYAACNWFQRFLSEETLPVCLDLPAMRGAQRPPGHEYKVSRNGSTLPWSVIDLAKDQPRYDEWHAHMATAVPFLCKVVGKQREDDRHAFLEVTYETGFSVRSVGLSDGTLTFLALTILPFLENVPPLVTVEEPENGVHPKAIETILESLQVIHGSQVWITTHSPIVVAVTHLDKLLCLQQTKTEGVKIIRGSEHPTLRTWKGQPDLSDLFSAGVL